jgi:hypothetical protein
MTGPNRTSNKSLGVEARIALVWVSDILHMRVI